MQVLNILCGRRLGIQNPYLCIFYQWLPFTEWLLHVRHSARHFIHISLALIIFIVISCRYRYDSHITDKEMETQEGTYLCKIAERLQNLTLYWCVLIQWDEEMMILRSYPRMMGLSLSQQLYPLQSRKEKGTAGIYMGTKDKERDSGTSGPHGDAGREARSPERKQRVKHNWSDRAHF